MATERITFVFTPVDTEEYPNSIEFTYEIAKGDYVAFTNYAANFCNHKLSHDEKNIILKTYPELKDKIRKNKGKYLRVGEAFGQSCEFCGVAKIGERRYEIEYEIEFY